MPNKSWTNFLRYSLALLFILGCRSVLGLDESENVGIPTPTPLEKPYSTFVPLRDVVEVKVNEELLLESYHISQDQLKDLTILVNDQLLRTEATSGYPNTFDSNLATVQVMLDDQAVVANIATPPLPTSAWTVMVRWIGHVPGTYTLSLQATDTADRVGDPVTQLIEVR
jgi:hypothetical protein